MLPINLKEEIILTKDDFYETIKLLKKVLHASCHRAAIHNYWLPCWNMDNNSALIKPNNIFWLYYWAETGQGSNFAAKESRIVFYEIFGAEKPYGNKYPDYENFFYLFDKALEMTGLQFRVGQTGDPKNNPVRDALRPIDCTDHCIEILKKVMENMKSIEIDATKLKPILVERSLIKKELLEIKINELYK